MINNVRFGRLLGGLAVVLVAAACQVETNNGIVGPDPDELDFAESLNIDVADFEQTSSGLLYRDDAVGEGDEATPGKYILVRTTGWLPNGAVFQPQIDIGDNPDQPVRVGVGNFIPGFDEGLTLMRAGGDRWIIIPPELGYGGSPPAGSGIPPNSYLVFRLQMLEVSDTPLEG